MPNIPINLMPVSLSIIIPVYNAEAYLVACVKSIVSQTFADYEVLLVDDGSTDRSGSLCDALAAQHAKVRVFHRPHQGLSAARNHGLREAQGEWIMFVDSDDELYDNLSLERFMQETEDGVQMAIAGHVRVDATGKEIIDDSQFERLTMDSQTYARCLLNSTYGYQGYVWAKLFRREIVLSGGVTFDETLSFCEDQHFVVQYLCVPDVKQICFNSNLKIYKYFVRTGSLKSSLRKGYNPKFFSDFLAYQKMASLLHARYNDVTIDELAKNNVLGSGYRVLGMMQIYHASCNEQKDYIVSELCKHDGSSVYEYKCQRSCSIALREMINGRPVKEKAETVYRWMHGDDCHFRYLNGKWKLLYILSVFAGKRGLELVANKI